MSAPIPFCKVRTGRPIPEPRGSPLPSPSPSPSPSCLVGRAVCLLLKKGSQTTRSLDLGVPCPRKKFSERKGRRCRIGFTVGLPKTVNSSRDTCTKVLSAQPVVANSNTAREREGIQFMFIISDVTLTNPQPRQKNRQGPRSITPTIEPISVSAFRFHSGLWRLSVVKSPTN
jgi:hypothetical protein